MADDADKVTALSEKTHESNLYTSRRDEPQAVAIGECLFCGEPFDEAQDRPGQPGRRWCDAACRDDWQMEND